ncbi:MAG TPA: vWA domain-containing protein [Longimicrobiales bacterium]|nr:vWA domain-containing protein [Longimicrobiales bacterium]
MSTRLGVWILLSLLGWAYAVWVYRRRELLVRSWRALALLRGAVLAMVLLLLLDLELPGAGRTLPSWTLVDASPSMRLESEGRAAADSVRALLGSDLDRIPLITFGDPIRVLPQGLAGDSLPAASDSRLAPAVVRALESGASGLRILTDLRVADPVDVAAALRSAPVPVEVVDVGRPMVNAGVADLELPASAPRDEPIDGAVTLFAETPGEVRLVLRRASEDGAILLDTTVVVERDGRSRIPVRIPGGPVAGPTAVIASVSREGDAYPLDDRLTRIVEVDPAEGRLVLVSWAPDWEPRFLLPVLEEVTGLPVQGYLRVGDDRFLTMTGDPRTVPLGEVVNAVDDARVAVIHGVGPGAPAALEAAVGRAPRLLRFTAAASPQPGEWYVAPDLPPSPVAGELAGVSLAGLPPLTGRVAVTRPGGAPVLEVQRGGSGEPVPGLTLDGSGGRRVAAVWARGFWQWGFRPGQARDAYRRLWSGVAGWLLAGGDGLREVGLSPARTVVAPGASLDWRAGPAAGGRIALGLAPDSLGAAAAVPDTLAVDSLGRVAHAAPGRPGRYRWQAEVLEGPGEGRVRSGLLVVEAPAGDLQPARAVSLLDATGRPPDDAGTGSGRPLRTHPLPYVLLLLLLTAEWMGRRRSGLR